VGRQRIRRCAFGRQATFRPSGEERQPAGDLSGREDDASSASDGTATVAFYRLIEMPEESAVTVANILAPHRERGIQRIRGQRTVLAVQDGTDLNFTRRPGTDGLQLIGKNQTGSKSLGLHLHATLAVTGTGLPLGVLGLGFDAAGARPEAAGSRRGTRRWIDGLDGIADAVREVGGRTRVVSVCDREAGRFEPFDARRRHPRVHLLVRAKHDRVLGPRQPKLFAAMASGAPDDLIDVEIDGMVARPKSSGRKARPARRRRLASCGLRFRQLKLPPTAGMEGAEPVRISAVHLVETAPPEDEEPVRWHLLTTLEVASAGAAAEVVGFYPGAGVWRISSGC